MKPGSGTDPNAPRPVHPRAVRNHGLFGLTFVRQHMMADERWTPNSLTEEFKGMADLLAKRLIFKRLEGKANRKRSFNRYRNLRTQTRDGRTKLHLLLYGQNTLNVRNYLINHKDMQRLYQKMPVHQVVDNINQRTFVMRKERDRLRFRLAQLKHSYHEKLLERAEIENRIKFEDEFILDEEIKSRTFLKLIENSNVRLKAIKTINGTYKKMIQVLRHDAIFYEPILRSLSLDIEDQASFIKHILYLGMPAIAKFKDLSEEYRLMEEKSRKNLLAKVQWVTNYRKQQPHKRVSGTAPKAVVKVDENNNNVQHYVRETQSMLMLKSELERIEDTIKQVKFATLCSQAKEIYPIIKSQVENNAKLKKNIENNMLGHQSIESKMKRAQVLEGVLVHNLSEEENARLNQIEAYKLDIVEADAFETQTLEYMKNRADVFVLLRFTLWNLSDILRHVDRSPNLQRISYPNSYLKLPLLKFEMLTMRACAPEFFEDNLDSVLYLLKRKVYRLMKVYKADSTKDQIMKNLNEYHKMFLETTQDDDDEGQDTQQAAAEEAEELVPEAKMLQSVPNRKQIKAQSAKLVEELSKKEE